MLSPSVLACGESESLFMKLIDLDDVSLIFRVRRHGRINFKDYLLKGMFRRSAQNTFEVRTLEHINLKINEGERVGILGHNGAGKSSLLKLLAGIYPPTSGRREVHGQISSLFDITLGFELDASGWENIMYRGYLQGETPRSIRSKIDPIAEFSELGDFLSMPVRYYSAGMMVRLAFSIATAIQPEILIVDEVLSAGDMSFQTKARERMRDLMQSARAVVVVSHDMSSLDKLCDRVLWLDHGHLRMEGPTADVIAAYTQQAGPLIQRQAA
jgi:ABC-type polysaccharide/polyol phosphate transport system ATPase subunit